MTQRRNPVLALGVQVTAELDHDARHHLAGRAHLVEYVGGPRCGDRDAVQYLGTIPPRRLPGNYHRIGARLCASGAYRYEQRTYSPSE